VTPAAILFCTTLVTAVPHGSVAQNHCRFIDPPFTGTKTTAIEKPVQHIIAASDVLPIAPAAEPVSKPVVQAVQAVQVVQVVQVAKTYKTKMRLNKPKMRRKIAHLTTFRRYGNFVVSPAGNKIPKKKERLSFWEELKRFDMLN
jgi:hypothetical protein